MEMKEVVKEKYGQAALRVISGGSSCCGASAALDGCCDPITSNLYSAAQTGELPQEGSFDKAGPQIGALCRGMHQIQVVLSNKERQGL